PLCLLALLSRGARVASLNHHHLLTLLQDPLLLPFHPARSIDMILPCGCNQPRIRRRELYSVSYPGEGHFHWVDLNRDSPGVHPCHSSSEHSSSGHFILGHSLSGHTPLDTTVADSSAPPRFFYLPLARTPRCSEAYRRWRSIPLSTMYPPMTSESSTRDSSFESSAGPSRKRCMSPTDSVPSSTPVSRSLAPNRAALLPPSKELVWWRGLRV
ncbi:hypothetical protein Tco_0066937, partial [Tanacetum coccineum]